ncbi:poly-beta-1,6-N-acetyl-D-glucosamine biosynthesis protein PgaD [Dyella sp. GSA-30]|uniref:poly-beta-1,6-N-acetyl-D-glucosamine biosynthesis protein PgaD n=1 Tax=Dyella sp. GSA-30 TaxID=2994496 RepID=UPI0024928C3A|nr:poly-beta-1,6-N-acetyl-D-glucosamine biosynthesis protein PgaD [Dyella sp. GSA-30]BDU19585.1 hypothetical protein DYGSA30_10420 [Dyella sp. GSA-30]
MNPPLIDRPDRLTRLRRTLWGAIATAAWLLYACLWVPLLTLFAWFLGIRTAYQRLYVDEHALDPFIVLALPVIALLCALVLIGWAEYNRFRFADADRRRRRRDVLESTVDERLGADHVLGERLRRHRIIRVLLDESAVPVRVEVLREE